MFYRIPVLHPNGYLFCPTESNEVPMYSGLHSLTICMYMLKRMRINHDKLYRRCIHESHLITIFSRILWDPGRRKKLMPCRTNISQHQATLTAEQTALTV